MRGRAAGSFGALARLARTIISGMRTVLAVLLVGLIAPPVATSRVGTLPPNETPLAGTSPVSHDSMTVDGARWSVTTYTDELREQCLTDVVPRVYYPAYEGGSLRCFKAGTIFANAPVMVGVSARPDPANNRTWAEMWIFGEAAPTVNRITLVTIDCSTHPVTLDKTGVFLDVVPQPMLGAGSWPYRLVAYNAADQVVFQNQFSIPEPPLPSTKAGGSRRRVHGPTPGAACASGSP